MASEPIRLAVLLSGSGTTLQNLLDRCRDGRLRARVALVVSSNADAFGLERARRAGVESIVINRKEAGSLEEFSRRIFERCRQASADLVCMAGFLQLIQVPDDFLGRVMNIHPALIPAFCGKGFYGRHVHEAVLAYGAKISGCTVHFADNQYDHGPIILQRAVPVLADDTPETLAARVFEQECEAYPEAIQWFAEGRGALRRSRCNVTIKQPAESSTAGVPRMDMSQFMRNMSAHSPEELAPYSDQHVAWSEDGKEILAHACDLSELYSDLDRRGITGYVIGYIPAADRSDLGGATLEV